MDAAFKQDLPPKGGYPKIDYARNLPRRGPSGLVTMLGGVAVMTFGFYMIARTNKQRRADSKEKLTARLALLPLLQAEQDRRVLRAMKAFEEEEAAIMKDVPGWVVGESVYHTDKWIPPHPAQLKGL